MRFEVLDEEVLLQRCEHVDGALSESPVGTKISIVIWTTTPWTLPANQAVAVNPGFDYVLVQCTGEHGPERLIVAEVLLKEVMARSGIEDYRVIATCIGESLEGLKLQHPFYEREVPVILGDHVTSEAGTGAVHTAPGHGQDDYVVGARYNLPVDNPVDGNGVFLPNTPLFAGQHVFKANDQVIEVLKTKGALLHEAALRHSYPHCWRHKTPIIFRATPQWFIRMDAVYPGAVGNERQGISMGQKNLRSDAMKAIKKVQWLPEWGQARIEGMIEKRPDWCVSRQRTWGVPITLFLHKESGELHPATAELIESVARRVEESGIDAWFELDAAELLGDEVDQYEKASDTLDVWFDSGVTHYSVLQQNDALAFPADLYLEGSDQHRGWFQSSLLTSVAMNGAAPYKSVLTHGFTVDAKGRKMSKSLGNVIAPQKIMNSLGADILRLWVAATDYRTEMNVSDEILKRMADAYRRMRNTARFLLSNLNGFDPATDVLPTEQMLALDQWAVIRAQQLQEEVRKDYGRYEFHLVYQKIHNFCAVDLGSFYLDIIKDRQYTTQADSVARRSAQTAMYHIVEALARWLAPVLSFTAEDIWQHMPGERSESIFLETWYQFPDAVTHTFGQDEWSTIIAVRESVSKELEGLRTGGVIGSALDAEVDLYCDDALLTLLSKLDDELRFVLITSYARVHQLNEKPADAVEVTQKDQPALWIAVKASTHAKCDRCWHHREDVGSHSEHPELCGRCIENVTGDGESRQFA